MEFVIVPGTDILMARFETRVSDFEAFEKAASYKREVEKLHFEQAPDHPVVNVNLADALSYCAWLTAEERKAGKLTSDQTYRIPTRQEWSAAAGLLSARKPNALGNANPDEVDLFPWGADWPPPQGAGNFSARDIPGFNDDFPFTSPVGKFMPTPEGIYDLAGNVWEWTQERELRAGNEGSLRGGSWAYFKQECLTSGYIYAVPADLRAPTFGFRCVMEDRARQMELRRVAAAEAAKKEKEIEEAKRKRREAADAALAAMEKEGSAARAMANSIDTSSTKAFVSGSPYTNSLGMKFPVGSAPVLIAETETTIKSVTAWANTAKKSISQQPTFSTDPNQAAVNLTWNEAVAFCDWLTTFERSKNLIPASARYRLPTDEEWSKAAGLSSEQGSTPDERHLANTSHYIGKTYPPEPHSANLDHPKMPGYQDRFAYVAPVGSFTPDAGALYDLGGNVSEWCQDSWTSAEGEAVARGPSWLTSDERSMLTSYRIHRPKDTGRFDIGFRCVLDLGS